MIVNTHYGKGSCGDGIQLSGLTIKTPPTKTIYKAGEVFDPTGMEVQAIYSNGATLICTGYSYNPAGGLTANDTEVVIVYTEGGVSLSVTQPITVVFVNPVFADNTWAEIIDACEKGNVPDSWAVGDSKTMTIDGTAYQIDIIGKDHDTYNPDGRSAPLTLQLHDCYNTTYAMHSTNTATQYLNTEMSYNHLPAILEKMPAEVKNGIKTVKKVGGTKNSTTTYNFATKLFLLSEFEVLGVVNTSKSQEGTQYEYYAAGNSKIKNKSGSATMWWLRSPSGGNFCSVSTYGTVGSGLETYPQSVSFAFCF